MGRCSGGSAAHLAAAARGFGAQSSVTTSLIALRLALVTVVLGRNAGPTAVGFLSVAMLPVTIAEVATSPLRTTAFAEQAKLAAAAGLGVLWHASAATPGAQRPSDLRPR